MSERVIGRVLKDYDRQSFYLATKYPGHQISDSYDPAAIFEEQLQKCGVEYFDFYLLHNVYEKSIETYTDPRWGIIDYFWSRRRTAASVTWASPPTAAWSCWRASCPATARTWSSVRSS